MQVKIYYHDTDCGGVVYYANYLKYLEEARTEFLAERGISVRDLAAGGTLFVVSRQEIDYKYPAVYGDTLTIDTCISETSAVRIFYEHKITNQRNQLIARAKTLLVCVDKELKPKSIPEEIKEKIVSKPL
jgi:acyl-CoA thioester hydrolase